MHKKSFWYVWCPTGSRPSHKHDCEFSANAEARRLATLNPGSQFVVLEARRAFEVNNMLVTEFDPDSDLPF